MDSQMSTRVTITLHVDMPTVAEARLLAEDMTTLANFVRAKYEPVDVDASADIDFSYGPQHEHLKENVDASE